MKRLFAVMFASFCCWGADAAVDNKLVNQAEKYLNSVTGLTGDFV